jgi:hypothetical protein
MTNREILTKAIEKAIASGWLPYFATFDTYMTKDNIVLRYPEGVSSVNFDYHMEGHVIGVSGYNLEPFTIIFNHDFAKALWPKHSWKSRDDGLCGSCGNGFAYTAQTGFDCWKEHLQQMVIAEDLIKYLGEHLE